MNYRLIQKAHDLVKWYVPILNRLPRDHKFGLGDRIIGNLYDLHAGLIHARYDKERVKRLETLNGLLDVLRHRTRTASENQAGLSSLVSLRAEQLLRPSTIVVCH